MCGSRATYHPYIHCRVLSEALLCPAGLGAVIQACVMPGDLLASLLPGLREDLAILTAQLPQDRCVCVRVHACVCVRACVRARVFKRVHARACIQLVTVSL